MRCDRASDVAVFDFQGTEALVGEEGIMGKGLLRRSVQCLLLMAAALCVGTPAWAQFERASISGTVTDEQGGVIPGATVTATSLQTNQTDVAVSDGSGYYNFPTLAPGQYSITAELQGFKKTTAQQRAGRRVRSLHHRLPAGRPASSPKR